MKPHRIKTMLLRAILRAFPSSLEDEETMSVFVGDREYMVELYVFDVTENAAKKKAGRL